MLFDKFDNKIKEAAEQHHPAYDENAWRKMESLLDQHLPQEKDRRRFFLLAFSVLVIGVGAFFFLSNPHAKNADQRVQQVKSSTAGDMQKDKANKNAPLVQPGADNANAEPTTDNIINGEPTKFADKEIKDKAAINQKSPVNSKAKQIDKNKLLSGNAASEKDNDVDVVQAEKRQDEVKQESIQVQPNDQVTKNENPVNNTAPEKDELPNSIQHAQATSSKKAPNKNGKPEIRNGFSFFVSAGPDVSKAENSKAGRVTMAWGLGVAYTLNRVTLRTGVFSANKIYWAGPEDYKLSYTPPPTWKFMGADANCRVIEIPVKLSYNFAVKNRSNWFAGAGLSSYLMKRENYVYEYKSNTTGSSYYHSYETKNENKHYFSVLDLSGGYSYQLSNTVSLSAEPYVEVPLTGIGAGKVRLNSGGVLFTVGVHPFRK